MRKNILCFLFAAVFMMVSFPVSAQQAVSADRDSADLQARLDETLELINQLSQMSSEQLDSMARKMVEDLHNPIESAPKAGSRINGHVLDIDGNRTNSIVKVCERDFVGRGVTITNSDSKDGFFMLVGIKSTENYLTFEAEGYETQKLPIDRSTYEVRLKPLSENNK